MVRQVERRANFQVTLETGFRRLSRIDDRAGPTAGFDVQTARSMTRLAANVLGVLSFRLQPSVGGSTKIARNIFMAGLATFGADELSARDTGRSENCSVGCAARKENYGQRGRSSGTPQQGFALTVNPSS